MGVCWRDEVAKLGTCVLKRLIRFEVNVSKVGKTHGAKRAKSL